MCPEDPREEERKEADVGPDHNGEPDAEKRPEDPGEEERKEADTKKRPEDPGEEERKHTETCPEDPGKEELQETEDLILDLTKTKKDDDEKKEPEEKHTENQDNPEGLDENPNYHNKLYSQGFEGGKDRDPDVDAGFAHNGEFDAEKRPEDLGEEECQDVEGRIRNLIEMKKYDDEKKEFEEKHTEN